MSETYTVSFPISDLTSKYGFNDGDLDPEFKGFVLDLGYPASIIDWDRTWLRVVRAALDKAGVVLAGGFRLQQYSGHNPVRLVDVLGEPVNRLEVPSLTVEQEFTIAEIEDLLVWGDDAVKHTEIGPNNTASDHIRMAMRYLQEAEELTGGLAVSGEIADTITLLESFVIYGIRE